MPEMDYKRILEERECPNCRSNKPGLKSDCMIKMHVLYGVPVSDVMEAWIRKQIFSGACKQRRPR